MSDFWEAYKRPEWQKKRLEIMEAAGFECAHCGEKDKTLNVHHGYYEKGKQPWEYPDESLWCFCEDCHKKVEGLKREFAAIVGVLWQGPREMLLGYALGLWLEGTTTPNQTAVIDSYEKAVGLANQRQINVNSLIANLEQNDEKINLERLQRLQEHHCSLCGEMRVRPMICPECALARRRGINND